MQQAIRVLVFQMARGGYVVEDILVALKGDDIHADRDEVWEIVRRAHVDQRKGEIPFSRNAGK